MSPLAQGPNGWYEIIQEGLERGQEKREIGFWVKFRPNMSSLRSSWTFKWSYVYLAKKEAKRGLGRIQKFGNLQHPCTEKW